MSTRSLISIKRDKNKYECIYCHSDGYLTYNGAMLLDHYNNRETIEKLLKLGNISCLCEKIDPDPTKEHSFDYDKRQDDVVVAYGRDRGEKDQESKILTLKQIKEYGWIEYVYIFDKDDKWKFFQPYSNEEIRDVKEELDKEYKQMEIKRPKDFYGYWTPESIKKEKKRQQEEEM